ncbi:MAG: nucleotidyltransferase domain-containing protein [Sphingopyxis sp.]|nr:nucleotidyltransferase domain-containing protein [Sphingopyxis sp.]
MSVSCIILYGSRARGDHRRESDVDLLGVVDSASISRTPAMRGANLHLYPFDYLVEKAKSGDLFLLHITQEGKALYDSFGIFRSLKDSFSYKEEYKEDILEGTSIAMFLNSSPSSLKKLNARKRMIWALRTILIGYAASRRVPIFSSKGLEEYSGVVGLKKVIDGKNTVSQTDMIDVAEQVINRFGNQKIIKTWPSGKLAQIKRVASAGRIAKSTIEIVYPSIDSINTDFQTPMHTYPNLTGAAEEA